MVEDKSQYRYLENDSQDEFLMKKNLDRKKGCVIGKMGEILRIINILYRKNSIYCFIVGIEQFIVINKFVVKN